MYYSLIRPIDHYKPVDHRSLSLLSYFDHLLKDTKHGLNNVVPYAVPWKQVAVHVMHATVPASQIMYALNASVVALCTVDESQVTCLGCLRFIVLSFIFDNMSH